MKAHFVYEALNFEKGMDPKKTLNIGRWMVEKIEIVMDHLVSEFGGSYTMKREPNYIECFYMNDLFSSGGRLIRYNFDDRSLSMSFPGMGWDIPIKDLSNFEDEVFIDLLQRRKNPELYIDVKI